MAGKIANNYGSLGVVFESGNGSILKDINGKEYVDFVSGIGVNCLGHNHPELVKAISKQITKQIHISNYYNSDIGLSFTEELLKASGMERVFYGNSGAEANEAAIKLSRKFGALSDEKQDKPAGTRKTIITLKNSFHGRTITTLRATGQDKFHSPYFAPYPEGFRHIEANNFDDLKNAFDETVCALFIESIQGEGGVNLLDASWAQAAEKAARDAGALVVVDEVQTGMGRTGSLFASTDLGIRPDVITVAKGIAAGIPMGACLIGSRIAEVFVAGDHQSTFGGNPLACAAGSVVLKILNQKSFLNRVKKLGELMIKTISEWQLPCIANVRGKGLMIGVDVTMPPSEVQKACLESGLCVSTAGTKTVRFLPPLVLTEDEAKKGLEIFKSVLLSF